jgi:hypothetical protein
MTKGAPVEQRANLSALRASAERLLAADQQAGDLERELRELLGEVAPALLAEPGVGSQPRPGRRGLGRPPVARRRLGEPPSTLAP